MDRARQKTDKRITQMERDMGRVYKNSALLSIQKEYMKYMRDVYKRTEPLLRAVKESDDKNIAENKRAYSNAVLALTTGNKKYNDIVKRYVQAMAKTNQQALDIANINMIDIYVDNYNQVAVDCRKAGIKVNE